MIDVIYFDHHDDSRKYQEEFISEINERFKNVKLVDAYDYIKGYRQEVHLPEEDKDNLYAWLIAYGWFEYSLTLQLIMMDKKEHKEFYKLIDLAKEEYPERFKKKTNDVKGN